MKREMEKWTRPDDKQMDNVDGRKRRVREALRDRLISLIDELICRLITLTDR